MSPSKEYSIHEFQSWRRVFLTATAWFLLQILPVSGAGSPAVLSVVDFSPYAYACVISDYGNGLTEETAYRAVLMQPPGDDQMCEFPSLQLSDVDPNIFVPISLNSSLALLVSMGGCDVYTKTEIALKIYERLSRSLKFIVFYNNDADSNDRIAPILPPREDSGIVVPDNIKKLAFLSISTSAGVNLMGLLQKHAEITGASPQFLREGYKGWDLEMVVERLLSIPKDPPPPPNPYETDTSGVNGGNFYWFRLILFALLIMSPCCRGAYMWWNGGGRIHYRRNENGRIVGLQYVAPVSYWYASNGVQANSVPISGRLTEEQVLALPEIHFKIRKEDEKPNDDNRDDTEDDVAQIDDVYIVVSSGSADESLGQTEAALNRVVPVNERVRADEEQVMGETLITSCTTCSICIEEFEPGELIRFLPRCKHAFHTQCIMPWLTERQGCCPLCKKCVIATDGDSDARGRDVMEDVEPSLRQEENRTDRGSIGAVVSPEEQTSSVPNENPDMVIHLSNLEVQSSVSPFVSNAEEDNTRTTGTRTQSE